MKVFWKSVPLTVANEMANKPGTEELLLPMEAIEELRACLEHSAKYLPPSGRTFQGWEVGLLDRFEGGE